MPRQHLPQSLCRAACREPWAGDSLLRAFRGVRRPGGSGRHQHRGIPLAEHKARDLKEFDFRSGDLLVAMEPRQVRAMSAALPPVPCQLTLLGLWSRPSRPHIHDPHRLSEAYWGRCFDVIDSAVLTIADRMRRAAR
jgi:Low molecular weight phosphotyrosine protein phosphatase